MPSATAAVRGVLERRRPDVLWLMPAPAAPEPAGRQPNMLLSQLIDEARMSHAGLAGRVNSELDTLYDHASVRRWIRDGQVPRGQVPELICEVLSAALGRMVTLADAGFGRRAPLTMVSDLETAPEFTAVVRRLMAWQEVSVRRLARTVHYDQGGLSKIIAGKRPCPAYLAKAIDEALGADGTVTAAAEAWRAQREREWAAGPPQLALKEQVAVLAAEIRELRAEVAALRQPGPRADVSGFGAELACLMDARGIGVRELARQVPCNPGHISNLRNGRDRPSPQLAARIEEILEAVPAGAARTGGGALRAWRRSRGLDVPALAREMRRACPDGHLPVPDALVRMIRRWEREGLKTERYELLYAAVLGVSPDALAAGPGAVREVQ